MAIDTSAEPVFVIARIVLLELSEINARDVLGSVAGIPTLGATGLLPPQISKPVAPKFLRTVTATKTEVA